MQIQNHVIEKCTRMRIEKPSYELSVGEIISRSFYLYRARFLLFFLPSLVAGIITGILTSAIFWYLPLPPSPTTGASPRTVTQWFWDVVTALIITAVLLGLVSAVISAIITGTVIKCASDIIEKGRGSLQEGFRFAMSKLVSLLGASVITGILIIVGLFLFVAPGIIFMVMFSLVVPTVIIEQKGVFESLARSRGLVSHRWGKTFVLFLILGLIILVVSWILTVITAPLGVVSSIVDSAIAAFVTPILPIATTFLYYSMVAREASQLPPPPPPFL